MTATQSAATVVLVHGAWHGAWCWEPVTAQLTATGVRSVAVDLPGHGSDHGRLEDLYGDAARVRQVLDGVDSPVILVGHSYGGAVISEAGDHPRVAHMVYVGALVLDVGESCMSAATDEAATAGISYEGRPDLSSGFVVAEDGSVSLDPATAAACLYNDCDAATVDWALARLGPQPIATLQQPASQAAWRSKPSTYLVCANDMAVHPDLQRILAKRCSASIELNTDHSPFLCQPDTLSGVLVELAQSAAA